MSLLPFCEWLASTEWSVALHESLWVYPLVESTHVWTLALFVGFAALLDLRLLGVAFTSVPVSEVARKLLPWTIAGFAVMVTTGLLLFYAIPVRTYQSVFFRAKVILLVLTGINVWVFHRSVWKRVAEWDRDEMPPRRARFAGVASLVLWALVVFAGRMIAYNWFDCDRQPQPAIVNWAAGCVVEGKQ
jgi:hypothetical protein